jgi:putative membrane protein
VGGAFVIVLAVLGALLFVLMVIGLTMSVMLLRRHTRTGPGAFIGGEKPEAGGDALEILKARYARGELTREQFLQMKQDIEQ